MMKPIKLEELILESISSMMYLASSIVST